MKICKYGIKKDIYVHTHCIVENVHDIYSEVKRTEEIILLIMDEEIISKKKKGKRCWSVPKINAREKIIKGLTAEYYKDQLRKTNFTFKIE